MVERGSEHLLEKVAAGDVAAFEELYARHSPLVYSLLLRILGNADDAREVLQEAFIQVWRRASLYDASRGSEIAWLISVARSRGIDRVRARRVMVNRESEAAQEISKAVSNVVTNEALNDAIANERSAAVREALAELPEAQRSALELAYFGGYSQSEIAERLSEPLGTVKTRMQLGMRKLRERLRHTLGT